MLFLMFLMLALGLFALFLGGGMVAQGYLYQNPAERMPLRAVAAAALVAGFVTLWAAIDRSNPGRYDTLFTFVAYTSTDFDEFEAVRWTGSDGKLDLSPEGKPNEVIVKFKRDSGAKDALFLEDGTGARFQMSGSTGTGEQYMTGAIRVKLENESEPVRYDATLKENPQTKEKTFAPETRFKEAKGDRYIEAHKLGTVFVPSSGTVVWALALNFGLFVVWLVALWPLMRFSFGHALMFSVAFATLTLVALPLLFGRNREPKPPPAPAPAAIRWQEPGARPWQT